MSKQQLIFLALGAAGLILGTVWISNMVISAKHEKAVQALYIEQSDTLKDQKSGFLEQIEYLTEQKQVLAERVSSRDERISEMTNQLARYDQLIQNSHEEIDALDSTGVLAELRSIRTAYQID